MFCHLANWISFIWCYMSGCYAKQLSKLAQFSVWMQKGSHCAAGMLWWRQHLIYTIWKLQLPWPNTGDSACDHMSGSGQSAVRASCTPTYVCSLRVELLGRDPGLYPGALLWQRALRVCVFFLQNGCAQAFRCLPHCVI